MSGKKQLDQSVGVPWLQDGYYQSVEKWINAELEGMGTLKTAEFEHIKESDLCLVLCIPTSKENYYFKAVSSAAKHEPALSKYLYATYPGKTVEVIAIHESEGWLLMKEIKGKSLRNLKDKQLWQQAIQEYAELQVSEVNDVENLLSIGVPDRRMPVIKEEIRNHLEDMCGTGLSLEETERVMALEPELLEMCDELDSIIPPAIEHGDLHTNNIRLINKDIIFFDWGDASVSHPFFSTRIFWHALDDLIESEEEWLGIVEEFRPFYLEPWTKIAPMEKLEKALRISDELACVQRALSWHLYITPSREDKADSFKKPAQWLRLLLEHKALVGK